MCEDTEGSKGKGPSVALPVSGGQPVDLLRSPLMAPWPGQAIADAGSLL